MADHEDTEDRRRYTPLPIASHEWTASNRVWNWQDQTELETANMLNEQGRPTAMNARSIWANTGHELKDDLAEADTAGKPASSSSSSGSQLPIAPFPTHSGHGEGAATETETVQKGPRKRELVARTADAPPPITINYGIIKRDQKLEAGQHQTNHKCSLCQRFFLSLKFVLGVEKGLVLSTGLGEHAPPAVKTPLQF